jgi:hypothetical protein
MVTITSVNIDVTGASVTITFSDASTQVITAPLVAQNQGTSLEDLNKIQADVTQTQTDVTAAIADATPATPVSEAADLSAPTE